MGWGRMLLLGNIGQQMDLEDHRQELARLKRRVRHSGTGASAEQLQALRQENAELRLYLAALVRYLKTKGLLDPAEFALLVDTVDAEDGATDGGYAGPVGQ